jgi:hypothetical protein
MNTKPIITQVLLFPVGWQKITRFDVVGELPYPYQSNKRFYLGSYSAETGIMTAATDAGIFVKLWAK